VFSSVGANYRNHVWLSERAILAAKNKNVDDMKIKIQSQITGQLHSFKSIDSITNPDEVVHYPIEFVRNAAAQFAAQVRLGNNHVTQSESTETLQWNKTCC